MTVELSSITILWAASSVGILWSAFKSVSEARKALAKPFEDNKDKIQTIEAALDKHQEKINNLEQRQEANAEDMRQLLSAVVVMLGHMESGNNTGELKKKHSELEEYIINKRR